MYSSRFNQNLFERQRKKNQLKVIIVLDEKIHIHNLSSLLTYLFIIEFLAFMRLSWFLQMWLLHNAH